VIRGVALLGVLLANLVTAFRISPTRFYLPDDPALPAADRMVEAAIAFVVQGKAIALFSILFGVGLAIQYERFSRLGEPGRWLRRRLLALLAFGLAHLLLIWNGDILVEYALAGLLVVPLLALPSGTLARIAIACLALYLLYPLIPFMPAWPDLATLQQEYRDAMRIYASASFAEIRRYSLHEFIVFVPVYLSLFPETLAYLLLGVLAWRSGVVRDASRHAALLWGIAACGIAGGAALTAIGHDTASLGGFAAALLAPSVMALGYGAAMLLLLRYPAAQGVLHVFAAPGRMAFTNYIMQSLVFTWVFFGYGLGLIGRVSAAQALAWGIAAYAAQALFSRWWLARFRFGPLEGLWRRATYGRA
jgi:uncharacterized protein